MFLIIIVCVLYLEPSATLEIIGNTTSTIHRGCGVEPSCLKCGSKGCIKCPNLIVYSSRKCVDSCPFGHKPIWSTWVDYMGLVCTHNGNFMGLSNNTLAVLTGVLTGTILCSIFLIAAIIYIKYKRKHLPQPSETSSELDDSPERRDFLKQLETLRPYAQNYLDMLNDTRRQLRELHREGDNSAISAYKPVVRDLAKILLLLNRPIDKILVPDDWEHLFNWAEKALKRYKRMSEVSQPQVAQLINFLQTPAYPTDSEPEYSLRGSTTMSTFKPDQVFGSSMSLQDVAINNFNANYDNKFNTSPLNPQWKFEYSLMTPTSEFNPAVWRNSKEYLSSSLFLEDDFGQLGFRPQDEITTEL